MKNAHDETTHKHRGHVPSRLSPRHLERLRDNTVLSILAAMLAFFAVYRFSGSTNIFFALANGIGAGGIIYLAVSSSQRLKG